MDYLHPPRDLLVARRRPEREEPVIFNPRPAALQAGVTRSRRLLLLARFEDFALDPFVLDDAALRLRVRHAFLAAALRFAETRFLAVLLAVLRFVVAMLMTPCVMKNMD